MTTTTDSNSSNSTTTSEEDSAHSIDDIFDAFRLCRVEELNRLTNANERNNQWINSLFMIIDMMGPRLFTPDEDLHSKLIPFLEEEAYSTLSDNKWGKYLLALCYERGIGVEKNDRKAVNLYKNSAKQGCSDAQWHLGICYGQGIGVEKAVNKAIELFHQSADEHNNVKACFSLAGCYELGNGVERDLAKALHYYQKAANLGFADAVHKVGHCYYTGQLLEQNYIEAIKYFERSKESVDESYYMLALCYDHGYGVERDDAKAFQHYLLAANRGHKLAQYNTGLSYQNGYGVEVNIGLGLKYLKQAADQGVVEAQLAIAQMFLTGTSSTKKSPFIALKYYGIAANEHHDAYAQYTLGVLYLMGQEVEKNLTESIRYFQMSANQGFPDAIFNLAIMHESGLGVEKDMRKAFQLYQAAADCGSSNAQFNLAMLFMRGEPGVVEVSVNRAVQLFQQSAEQGNILALFNLGLAFWNGDGVAQNFEQAIAHFTMSADGGYIVAQYRLGVVYEHGDHVDANQDKALYYYRLSASQGHNLAKDAMVRLGGDFSGEPAPTSEEVSSARRGDN